MSNQLHYRGDCRNFDPDHIMGPDVFGACYVAAAAEYDAERDMTTLTLRPLPPAELQQRLVGGIR
jgi:hypothetical protein